MLVGLRLTTSAHSQRKDDQAADSLVFPLRIPRRLCASAVRTTAALFLFLTLTLPAQDRHPITGRRYANVMGAAGADWLTRPEREAEEQPDRALDLIGIAKDSIIA